MMISSHNLFWIYNIIQLSLVWVIAIVIIPLLSSFWTSTPTHISHMLINKLQLFCSFLLLDLNWFHMSKGMFLMSLVQSIYLSIGTLLVQSIDLSIALYRFDLLIYLLHLQFSHLYLISSWVNFSNPYLILLSYLTWLHMSKDMFPLQPIQSIYLFIRPCLFRLFTYPLCLVYVIYFHIYYILFAHLSIAFILSMVSRKSPCWNSIIRHPIFKSSAKFKGK